MKPRIDPPFWSAVLLRTDLYNFLMAWSGIGAALGLLALTVQDALRKRRARRVFRDAGPGSDPGLYVVVGLTAPKKTK